MHTVIFDPRKTEYKNPHGAVAAGGSVRFCLRPPRAMGLRGAALLLDLEQLGEKRAFPLRFQGRQGGLELYGIELSLPAQPGLVWYHFRLDSAFGPLYLGKKGLADQTPFQLTVYRPAADVPTWFGEGVVYQIFPDRFSRTALPDLQALDKPGRLHENWMDMPDWRPDAHGKITNSDFFGGSLLGIQEKLPYLETLGVTVLYLNPIFKAASNHRYDTGDYCAIDPLLGDESAFSALCAAAKAHGIRVVLDGVFSHTGDDSLYFNKYGRYPGLGAYQSPDSPYASWYSFSHFPDQYAAWWGIDTLPEVQEDTPSYRAFIAGGESSVVRRWLRAGASGWRLDVADELPDDFIEAVKAAARAEKADAFLLGEVWEDATNKISYGTRRRYLWDGALDGVMNYPFNRALLAYLLGGPAEAFLEAMETLRENYPPAAFYNCMNFLGTHDTPRILTLLGAKNRPESREDRAAYRLSAEEYALGKKRLLLAAAILFAFPGAPTIYYGDEAGMQGFEDPFNRAAYPWGREDAEILSHFRALAQLRKASPALRRGDIRFLCAHGPLLAFSRNLAGEKSVLCLVNAGAEAACLTLAGQSYPLPPHSAKLLED